MSRQTFKVLGAGPAGLTAAITAAHAGIEVEVFERRSACGARFHDDFQCIENWSGDRSFLDDVQAWGISLEGLYVAPFSETVIIDPRGHEHMARSHRPAVHVVRRGTAPDTLDQSLYRAALTSGVKVHFGRTVPCEACDVIAIGPQRPTGYVTGTLFRTRAKDRTAILLNRRIAPSGYGYLICTGGQGLAAATILEHKAPLPVGHGQLALTAFQHHFSDLTVEAPRTFGGFGQFGLPPSFHRGQALLAGESAGLQDALWGFGIRTAMISGRLAARAHLEGFDYEAALEEHLLPSARVSLVNRWLYEQMQDTVGQLLVGAWRWEQRLRGDGLPFIRRLYRPDPFRWRCFGRRASSELESGALAATLPLKRRQR